MTPSNFRTSASHQPGGDGDARATAGPSVLSGDRSLDPRRPWLRRAAALAGWVAPFAAVAALLGWETGWGQHVAAPAEVASAPVAPQPVSISLLPDYRIEGGLDARVETVDRTLFNPTRRRAPVASQEGARPRMQRGQFVLTGTALSGSTTIAFLREASSGKSRSAKPGDTINGLTVAEVRADGVRLRQGDEVEDLGLKVAAAAKPPPAQATTPAPMAPGAVPPPGAVPAVISPPAAPSGTAAPGQPAPPAAAGTPIEERRREMQRELAAQRAAAAANETAGKGAAPPPPAEATDPRWGEVFRRYGRQSGSNPQPGK